MKNINTRNDILLRITGLLREVLEQPDLEISLDTTADQVAGWDSLTHMTIITRVEQDFSIEFRFQEIIALENVGDLVNRVAEKKGMDAV